MSSTTGSRFSMSSKSKISLGNCHFRRYLDYSTLSVHSLPGHTWRQQAGFRRLLSDVVCPLVGNLMFL
jgi:hypothetical protein